MASKALFVVRMATEASIISVLTFLIWAWFFAMPLKILATVVIEDGDRYIQPGDYIEIVNVSEKEMWAVAVCKAVSSVVNFQDERGYVAQYYENNLNYNDGSIKKHPGLVPVPKGLEPGLVKVYKTVTYSCWNGWMEYRAITPANGWGNFLLEKIR